MTTASTTKHKQSPYVGYFRANGSRTESRLFEPNSNPHVGVYRHAPAKTTSNGLQEILRDKKNVLKQPKSVVSTMLLFSSGTTPKHFGKKTLESMPTSHYVSNRDHESGEVETPMCPICLENFVDGDEIRNLKCSHCFHKSCIDIWLLGTLSSDMTTTVCPSCRQDASNAIAESGSGSVVYNAAGGSPSPVSTIPAECFLRVGQYLLQESSRTPGNTAEFSSSQSNALPPIASTRSPPLPPKLQAPVPQQAITFSCLTSPTAALLMSSKGSIANKNLSPSSSSTSMTSTDSNTSTPPAFLFSDILDDSYIDDTNSNFSTSINTTDNFSCGVEENSHEDQSPSHSFVKINASFFSFESKR